MAVNRGSKKTCGVWGASGPFQAGTAGLLLYALQGQLWELMEALFTGSVLGHPSIFPAKPGSPALPEILKANNKI